MLGGRPSGDGREGGPARPQLRRALARCGGSTRAFARTSGATSSAAATTPTTARCARRRGRGADAVQRPRHVDRQRGLLPAGLRGGPRARVVVDIGSNIGISALYFLTRNPACRCWLYEPVPRNVERLRANLRRLRGPLRAHGGAVADAARAGRVRRRGQRALRRHRGRARDARSRWRASASTRCSRRCSSRRRPWTS